MLHNHSTTLDMSSLVSPNSKFKKSTNSSFTAGMFLKEDTDISSPNISQKSYLFCRICHEGDGTSNSGSPASSASNSRGEMLLSPCKCSGTTALIHLSCLERWLTASNSDRCEICQFVYKTERVPRTCNEYLTASGNEFNIRNLIADIVCFALLTPLLVLSTYLCVLGANQYFAKERWEAVGLIILSLFLLGVYFTWCHVTIRYHTTVWKSWQRTNQQVRVILGNDECYHSLRSSPLPHNQPVVMVSVPMPSHEDAENNNNNRYIINTTNSTALSLP